MASDDKTIIYYTANTEDPVFEQRIRDDLKKKAGDIPIISVSRKPIDLGTNICVGEQTVCYTNEWKQLLVGLKAAKTKFCFTAEADCLYPANYFSFTPPVDNMMHYYDNLWIVWKYHNAFWRKTGHCEGAEVCGREYWISRLEPLLLDSWEPIADPAERMRYENKLVTKFFPKEDVWKGEPVISFKTRDGLSFRTTFINQSKTKVLPPWGTISEVKKIFI